MAAAATLTSTTLENQLVEVIERVAIKQSNTADNPDGVTVVTAYNRNNLTGVVSVTLSIPTNDAIDPDDGSIDVLAQSVFL